MGDVFKRDKPVITIDPAAFGFTLNGSPEAQRQLEQLRDEYAKGWLRCQKLMLD